MPAAEQRDKVDPAVVGVPASHHQDVVPQEVHLSEQGVEQQVQRPHHGLVACFPFVFGLRALDSPSISLQDPAAQVEDSTGSGSGNCHCWLKPGTPGDCLSQGWTWGPSTPRSRPPRLSARVEHFAGAVACWCMAPGVAESRPEVLSWLIGARVRRPPPVHPLFR